MIKIIGTEKEIREFVDNHLNCLDISEEICKNYIENNGCVDCILENEKKYIFIFKEEGK